MSLLRAVVICHVSAHKPLDEILGLLNPFETFVVSVEQFVSAQMETVMQLFCLPGCCSTRQGQCGHQ